jgi:hypothetical protein
MTRMPPSRGIQRRGRVPVWIERHRPGVDALGVMLRRTNHRITMLVGVGLLLPHLARANSMAPVFPVVSMFGWPALPIIILFFLIGLIRLIIRYKMKT